MLTKWKLVSLLGFLVGSSLSLRFQSLSATKTKEPVTIQIERSISSKVFCYQLQIRITEKLQNVREEMQTPFPINLKGIEVSSGTDL